MKLAAFGRTDWLLNGVKALHAAGNEIVLVGTAKAAPEYAVTEKDFETFAKKCGAEFFCGGSLSSRMDLIRHSGAEAAVSINWPSLVEQRVIDLFGGRVINAHAGDLPRFRGNACPNWAIINGEQRVVVSLHWMAAELDAGPILAQTAIPLTEETYVAEVYEQMLAHIPRMLVETIDALSRGDLCEIAQSDRGVRPLRCFPRTPDDGCLDWGNSARALHRLIRASGPPFEGAFTFHDMKLMRVWRARTAELDHDHLGVPGQVIAIDRASGEVSVLTGEGVLVLQEVSLDGQPPMSPDRLLTSTRIRLGINLARLARDLIAGRIGPGSGQGV